MPTATTKKLPTNKPTTAKQNYIILQSNYILATILANSPEEALKMYSVDYHDHIDIEDEFTVCVKVGKYKVTEKAVTFEKFN